MSNGWSSADDHRESGLLGDFRAELQAIVTAETGLSNRFLSFADWILDLSMRPLGRVTVGVVALTLAYWLI